MAEVKLPVYVRVGQGPDVCVGEITSGTADEVAPEIPRILRALADELEAQAAAGRDA